MNILKDFQKRALLKNIFLIFENYIPDLSCGILLSYISFKGLSCWKKKWKLLNIKQNNEDIITSSKTEKMIK